MKPTVRWMVVVSLSVVLWTCNSPGPTVPIISSPQPTQLLSPISTGTAPAPIVTPTGAASPPLNGGPLPAITRDVLFVNEHAVMRWNHIDNQIETLIDQDIRPAPWLQSFSASADGQRMAITMRMLADVYGDYGVTVYDARTKQSKLIVPLKRPLAAAYPVLISPDGRWVAYIRLGTSPTSRSGLMLAAPAVHPASGGAAYGLIYAAQIDTSDKPIEVGFCREIRLETEWRSCMGFLWSPDSQRIIWSDADGVKVAEPGQRARLITPYTIGVPAMQAASTVDLVAWSLLGRYVLVKIGHHEGWNFAVLDSQTGQVAELPGLLENAYPHPSIGWLHDQRLFAIRATSKSDKPYFGEIWRVDSTDRLTLTHEITFSLPISGESWPTVPTQLSDGSLAFVALNALASDDQERGVYVVNLNTLQFRRANSLPAMKESIDRTIYKTPEKFIFEAHTYWSPDGAWLIFYDRFGGSLIYVPMNGGPLYDLRSAVGGPYFWLDPVHVASE